MRHSGIQGWAGRCFIKTNEVGLYIIDSQIDPSNSGFVFDRIALAWITIAIPNPGALLYENDLTLLFSLGRCFLFSNTVTI